MGRRLLANTAAMRPETGAVRASARRQVHHREGRGERVWRERAWLCCTRGDLLIKGRVMQI